jgi:hypothetical protein
MKLALLLSGLAFFTTGCSLHHGLWKAELIDQRLDVKDGKELLTRRYLVDGTTGKTVTETLEVRSDIFTGMAGVIKPTPPSTLTRDQVVRALVVAIRRSGLELPREVEARAAFYKPVPHETAVQLTVQRPTNERPENAVGYITVMRKGNTTTEDLIVYLDPVNGACLVDHQGRRVSWTNLERAEIAKI